MHADPFIWTSARRSRTPASSQGVLAMLGTPKVEPPTRHASGLRRAEGCRHAGRTRHPSSRGRTAILGTITAPEVVHAGRFLEPRSTKLRHAEGELPTSKCGGYELRRAEGRTRPPPGCVCTTCSGMSMAQIAEPFTRVHPQPSACRRCPNDESLWTSACRRSWTWHLGNVTAEGARQLPGPPASRGRAHGLIRSHPIRLRHAEVVVLKRQPANRVRHAEGELSNVGMNTTFGVPKVSAPIAVGLASS